MTPFINLEVGTLVRYRYGGEAWAFSAQTTSQARPADMVELNTGFAQALQLLTDFYQHSGKADPAATLQALRDHLEQVAYHQHNVAAFTTPELEF